MPKMFFAFLLFLGGLTLPLQAAPLSDSPGTSAAAQDGGGTVWAVPGNNGPDNAVKINRWQAGAWVSQDVPEAAGFRLLSLTRGGDGAVDALWQKSNQGQPDPQHWLVTRQRGLDIRVLARFEGPVASQAGLSGAPALFAGAAGDVWVSGNQPVLRHIAPDGTVQVFPLKAE